ncbi:MAG: hypothetical protein JKY86_01230 [Gammaproteobacteria bacterium]|nr:hypothetical protein [Gammaproteobacteria bacterium]
MSNKKKPSEILSDVREAFTKLPKGKASHNRHWVSAYDILGLLSEELQEQLINERCDPGKGGGQHYSAASVVAGACEMLSNRGEVDLSFYAPTGATKYEIVRKGFSAGYELCGIYRLRWPVEAGQCNKGHFSTFLAKLDCLAVAVTERKAVAGITNAYAEAKKELMACDDCHKVFESFKS